MKVLIKLLIPIIVFGLSVWGDIALFKYIVSIIPATEWLGFIKLGIGIAIFVLTAGLITTITMITSMITDIIIGN